MAEQENPDQEQIFIKYHDRLRSELNNAHWHFEIWKKIRQLQSDYQKELNQAPAFWGLTLHAHLLETVMRLNNICDKDTKTLNIHKLLNFAEQNMEIFSDKALENRLKGKGGYDAAMELLKNNPPKLDNKVLQENREKFEDYSINSLRKWRDKFIAHIDRGVVLKDLRIFEEYPVEVKQIEKIINDLDETLNTMLLAFNFGMWSKELSVANDVKAILDTIRDSIQERRRKIHETRTE